MNRQYKQHINRSTVVYKGITIFIDAVSENALLLTWPEKISASNHQTIINIEQQIKNEFADYVVETIASYNSLLVYYKFEKINAKVFKDRVSDLVQALLTCDIEHRSVSANAKKHNHVNNDPSNTVIEIPVYYGQFGHNDTCSDLSDVASHTGLSEQEVVELHTNTIYRAYALGFTPGFCYLGQLPEALQLPRKASPRLNVPKGAVAIAQQQTAVYPNNSPGGWHIIGRTPIDMYQGSTSNGKSDFLPKIQVGQQVKFIPISLETFMELGDSAPEPISTHTAECYKIGAKDNIEQVDGESTELEQQFALKVEQLNGRCTFQDLGRLNSQHLGFSASGASDEFAYLFANKLLGNSFDAPVIEITLAQIKLTVLIDCQIALTGADCQAKINDFSVSHWQCLNLKEGDILQLSNLNQFPQTKNNNDTDRKNRKSNGLHTYLAIKNGVNCQYWLGSASQNMNELALGFTGKNIGQGDFISAKPQPQQAHQIHYTQEDHQAGEIKLKSLLERSQLRHPLWKNLWHESFPIMSPLKTESSSKKQAEPLILRFIPSPLFMSLPASQQTALLTQQLTISGNSNRMGYRLTPEINILINEQSEAGELSKPVCFGTIQLPPNGEPIVLMKDRQTIGGYLVLGTVMQTDLFRLAQKRPGETVQLLVTNLVFAQQQLLSFYQRFQ